MADEPDLVASVRSSLLAAIAQSGVSHRLNCGDPAWPLDIIAGGEAQDVGRDALEAFLSVKDLIVIGCSLGNSRAHSPFALRNEQS